MSPVASRVLTRLSPSEPPGRVSDFTVMSGLAFWNAAMSALALATSVSVEPDRKVIVVVAPPSSPPELLPRLPALQLVNASVADAAKAPTASNRRATG